MMICAMRDERRTPKLPEHFDLLLHAVPARFELHAERLVFHMIPSESNTEPEASAAQAIDLRGLFRNKDGLALRQDQDTGCQLNPLCHSCKKTEQHHRLVKWILVRVRSGESSGAVRIRTKHVIVDEEVIVSERFRCLSIVSDFFGIVSEFDLWKNNAVMHNVNL